MNVAAICSKPTSFKSDLVVLVVGVAGPIADAGDGDGVRAILALAGDLGLLHPDVGQARRPIEDWGM